MLDSDESALGLDELSLVESFLYEQTTSRYFWFLWRLLSHVVDCDGNQIFTHEKITKIKEKDPKENYAGIHFLPYDNFPKTFDAFLKEIRLN
jgi:hypothetical protein